MKSGEDLSPQNRAAVLETVWPWRSGLGLAGPSLSKIRWGAVGQGFIGGAVGTLVYYFLSTTVGMVAWGVSALLALIGLASPTGLYAKVSAGFEAFGRLVGIFMSWLLLVPVYYLFFTPFRFLFRRGKKDAMTRWLDEKAESYWVERPAESPPPESYERQF